ncbi:MAG: FAD-dependent oxidoreductase [Pseudomonadota bacterium]
MSKTINADLCIIGAGSGGLSLAAGAAQLGRKVVLFEKSEMGGDCLNVGCVPSKSLIAAASRAHAMRTADKFGVRPVEPEVDYAAVMDHVQGVIAEIAPHDSQERFEGLGVTVIREHARFSGPREVVSDSARVKAKHIVIATGSRPHIPPIKGLQTTPYFTNETLWSNRTLPAHLIVIGGGPIGVELAQAHRRLGSIVTLIEGGDAVLNKDDPELVDVVERQLTDDGIDIRKGAMVDEIGGAGGDLWVRAGGETIHGSHLLIAAGRAPAVDGLELEKAGVEYTERGVKVDNRLKTTSDRIYAMGDVAGGLQFTHVAGYHASVLVRRILFKTPAKNNESISPWVTYSDPELAHVGLTEASAREKHGDVKTVKWETLENDRAKAERDTRGLIKVVTEKNGKILGASIAGAGAGDLILPWAASIAAGDKIKRFTDAIAPYPTRGELTKRAAGQWYTPTLFSDKTRFFVSLLATFD